MQKRTNPVLKSNNSIFDFFKQFDSTLLLLLLVFLAFGLVIIYDATAVLSQDIYGIPYRFVLLQFAWILIGMFGFFIMATLNINTLKRIATPLFFVSLGILGVLGFFGVMPCSTDFMFAPCINGANRWFYLNPQPLPSLPLFGILGFQPSELAKLSLIVFLAAIIEKNISIKKEIKFYGYDFNVSAAFISFIVVTGLFSLLVLLQPNLSTAALIFLIGLTMYVVSGSPLLYLFLSVPVVLVGGIMLIVFSPYRRERLLTFLSFNVDESLSSGYHIQQILIALGSGGVFGLGLGQSRQKFRYLPEVFADSIFAIIGEELGFVGTSLLVLMFGFLIYKGFSIAKDANTLFERLLASGITAWVALQFFVNVAAMTKLIPLTGIPLPLISYGGSSLVFMLMGLGILANVSRKK